MKIYSISGKAESGKDSACEVIREHYERKGLKVCHLLFAKYIKMYAKEYFGWDGSEETKPRELLQKIGTDTIRERLGKIDFHVDRLTEDVEILSDYFDIFLISDTRFENEVSKMKYKFGKDITHIRIERPNHISKLSYEQLQHSSESSLDNYTEWDYMIFNNGTLEEFEEMVKNTLTE